MAFIIGIIGQRQQHQFIGVHECNGPDSRHQFDAHYFARGT